MIKEAIQALEANNWDAAHEIVQKLENTDAYWLHGILHTVQGDVDNARYWYRRAGRRFLQEARVEDEIRAIKAKFGIK